MRVINVLAAAILMLSSSSFVQVTTAAPCNVAFRKAPAAGHTTKKVVAGKTFTFTQSIKNTGSTKLNNLYFQIELPAYLVPVKTRAPKFMKGSDTLLETQKVLFSDMQLPARKTLRVKVTIGVKGCQSAGNVQIEGSAYQLDSTDQVVCSSDMAPYTLNVVQKKSASNNKWGASQKHATWDDDNCNPPGPVTLQFNSSTTWTVPAGVTSVEVCVVAGGGGGGYDVGGGGGAGGFIYVSASAVTPSQSITITIGGGGAGGQNLNVGSNGQNTVFGSLTAIGGAGGQGADSSTVGTTGGSGGGAAVFAVEPGGSTVGQGNNGGGNSFASGGGGGGAGGAGANSPGNTEGGAGGAGKVCTIDGVIYAGGGGGGASVTPGTGGSGGGGDGGILGDGVNGLTNTGGGGGGGGASGGASPNGGSGGSGIVIIKYQPAP